MLKKLAKFIETLVRKAISDRLLSTSNELSFKLLLALFPFITLCFAILGFLNIDSATFLNYLDGAVPDAFLGIVKIIVLEIVETRSVGLLSVSLFVAIFSASSGFYAVIRSVNKSYGQKETRNIVVVRLLSIALVFVFIMSIASAIVFIAINTNVVNMFLASINVSYYTAYIAGFFANTISLLVLLLNTMVIYKLASCKRVGYVSVLPGALCTVICWVIATKLFTVYITNFSSYSKVYGSIGSVVVLMLWINILSIVFLFGSEINALLEVR